MDNKLEFRAKPPEPECRPTLVFWDGKKIGEFSKLNETAVSADHLFLANLTINEEIELGGFMQGVGSSPEAAVKSALESGEKGLQSLLDQCRLVKSQICG